jgi:malonyl-CoA O-methyltransferase
MSTRYSKGGEAIRASFDRSAPLYHQHARFQVDTALDLAATVERSGITGALLVDIGCGTGAVIDGILRHQRSHSRQRFDQIMGIDFSLPMVKTARNRIDDSRTLFVQGNGEQLPLANNSAAVVTSNLTLQWTGGEGTGIFSETARILRPEGKLFMTSLGPSTFFELRNAMTAAGEAVRRPVDITRFFPFPSANALIESAASVGLMLTIEPKLVRRNYHTVRDMLAAVKRIGAFGGGGGPLHRYGLGRRRIMDRFALEYATRFPGGRGEGVGVTYELFQITGSLL